MNEHVVIYLRVGQDAPPSALSEQEAAVRALLRRHGIEDEPARVVQDVGSGSDPDRPGWNRILSMLDYGEIDVLAAHDPSRLTRDDALWRWLVDDMASYGGRVLTCTTGPLPPLQVEDDVA